MGYRKYAKDFEIEYVDQPGKKRQKAVRIYVGPYFRFKASAEIITRAKWLYLLGVIAVAALLATPMCIDCTLTRIWYVQGFAAAAVIPLCLMAAATWRLWTAGEKVEREHCDLLCDRMGGSSLFLMCFCCAGVAGCILASSKVQLQRPDLTVCACCVASAVLSVVLFSRRKDLEMLPEENPEKPWKQK